MKGLSLSGQMIVPWLAGNKTVTRRLMNPQPTESVECIHGIWCEQWDVERGDGYVDQDARPLKQRYFPGETVYIKETWGVGEYSNPHPIDILNNTAPVRYKCGYERDGGEIVKWKSPRFMPERAARSHALIVSVRPERVQEITEGEAIREGVKADPVMIDGVPPVRYFCRDSFRRLWMNLHPGSWERNDWVWRIELKKEAL